MTDDLVKRLRDKYWAHMCTREAADRIEQLDASSEGWKEIADEYFDAICERNTRIEKLEAALRWIVEQEKQTAHPTVCEIVKVARKTLEGKDD